MKATIVYNPLLRIEDNAKRNNVSIATIRKFIKDNGIDRRLDERKRKYWKIKELKKANPSITIKQIQKKLGYSFYTVKQYMNMSEADLHVQDGKYSSFDLANSNNIIRSVSEWQDEILKNILKLYIPKGCFDCDLTFSRGLFYKNIQQPQHKYDKYPINDTVSNLDEAYKLDDGIFNSLVIDLPFIVRNGIGENKSIISNRFNHFNSVEELYSSNEAMMRLAYRLLAPKGILVMKTMDINQDGRQLWVSNYVQNRAIEIGYELIDTFILVNNAKILLPKGNIQHCARKCHSYFLVFKRK